MPKARARRDVQIVRSASDGARPRPARGTPIEIGIVPAPWRRAQGDPVAPRIGAGRAVFGEKSAARTPILDQQPDPAHGSLDEMEVPAPDPPTATVRREAVRRSPSNQDLVRFLYR